MVCMGIPESRRKATLFTITRCRHRFHRWRPLHRPLRRWAKKNGYHQDAHTLVRTFLFESTQNYMTSQPNRLVLSRLEFAVRPRGIDRGSGIGRRKKVCWCNGGISSQGREEAANSIRANTSEPSAAWRWKWHHRAQPRGDDVLDVRQPQLKGDLLLGCGTHDW